MSGRARRVEEIFAGALQQPTSLRLRWVEAQCEQDTQLRDEVISLLDHHRSDEFLDPEEIRGLTVAGAGMSFDEEPPLRPGTRVGEFTILSVIGSGGMGAVYVAEQERPRRTVAIKVLRPGVGTAGLVRRFEHEAEILGRLQHPGIAQVFGAGTAEVNGTRVPYIAMEFIKGHTLIEHARIAALRTREKLSVVERVCDAVHHAHQRGVIHRDLKPANILVDEEGNPKVLDFGVARLQQHAFTSIGVQTLHTGVGQLIGTLPYMSPEQVGGDPAQVDIRSDVYALGVVLYQLLTGKLPHEVASRSIPDAARMIRDDEPARMSSIDRSLRGDIDVIVATALAKEPARRYQSAAALGADLQRYLASEPITARQDSALYVLRKQARRYRTFLAAASVAVLALAGFAFWSVRGAARERELTRIATQRAEELRSSLYSSRIAMAQAAMMSNDVSNATRALADCPEDLRGWEWRYLSGQVSAEAYSFRAETRGWGDGTASNSGTMVAWNIDTQHMALWPPPAQRGAADPIAVTSPDLVSLACIAPDGDTFVTVLRDGRVLLRRIPRCETVWEAKLGAPPVCRCAFSADGKRLALAEATAVKVFDMATGEQLRSLASPVDAVTAITLDAAGGTLFAAGRAGAIARWDLATDEPPLVRESAHEGTIAGLALNPAEDELASAGIDTTVRTFAARTLVARITIRSHENKAICCAYSPDGHQLLSGGTQGVILVHEASSGKLLQRLLGHAERVISLKFLADGRLMSYSIEGVGRVWDTLGKPEATTFELPRFFGAAITAQGDRIAMVEQRGAISAISMENGEQLWQTSSPGATLPNQPDFSPDGRLFAAPCGATVALLDGATGAVLRELVGHEKETARVRFSPDGRLIASSSADGMCIVWKAEDGACAATMTCSGPIVGLGWSPSGKLLATGDADTPFLVRVWDVDSGREVATLPGSAAGLYDVVWAREDVILGGGQDGVVRSWNTGTRECRELLDSHGPVYCMSLSPDGSRLLTGGFDNCVRVMDMATGRELISLRSPTSAVLRAELVRGGTRLAAVSGDRKLRIWEGRKK